MVEIRNLSPMFLIPWIQTICGRVGEGFWDTRGPRWGPLVRQKVKKALSEAGHRIWKGNGPFRLDFETSGAD